MRRAPRVRPRRFSFLHVVSVALLLLLALSLRDVYCTPAPVADAQQVEVLIGEKADGRLNVGETIRIHRPFYLAPTATLNTAPLNLTCTDMARRMRHNESTCRHTLGAQDAYHTGVQLEAVEGVSALAPTRCRCGAATAVVVSIAWRDYNVCHLLMRLLLAYTVSQRAALSPRWLRIPPVRAVYVLAHDPHDYARLVSPGTFHRGLLDALFVRRGIRVVALRNLSDMAARRACYAAAAFVGSHANRFAYPDAVFGHNAAYNLGDLLASIPSRPGLLSSDALALRHAVYYPRPPPAMSHVLLYVARGDKSRRRWNPTSELRFRSMLGRLAARHAATYRVFEPPPNATATTFSRQIAAFADAAVIVGMHGAGLALAAFAPPGAALVEIEPDYHSLRLFHNLQSSGLHYRLLTLQAATMDSEAPMQASILVDEDERRIRHALEDELRERRHLGGGVL